MNILKWCNREHYWSMKNIIETWTRFESNAAVSGAPSTAVCPHEGLLFQTPRSRIYWKTTSSHPGNIIIRSHPLCFIHNVCQACTEWRQENGVERKAHGDPRKRYSRPFVCLLAARRTFCLKTPGGSFTSLAPTVHHKIEFLILNYFLKVREDHSLKV
jgi:hypothetical protein